MYKYLIQYLVIKRSGFFDQNFYLLNNPDVREADIDPLMHYIKLGWRENRDPGVNFSTSWYRRTYDDVEKAGINPLYHYLKFGIQEGRQIKKLPPKIKGKLSNIGKKSVDFLIIGAQRAGTTSLFKFLDLLPKFCGSMQKEVGYFSMDSHYEKGNNWYHQQFKFCYPEQLAFEATPEYLYYPFVPPRIKKYKREMKLIVLLRDPVERCYSAWKLFRGIHRFDPGTKARMIQGSRKQERESLADLLMGENFPSFSSVVNDDLERFHQQSDILEPSFVRRGLYFMQLSHWIKFFDLSNFLFIEINALNDSAKIKREIQTFLAIKYDMDISTPEMPKHNVQEREILSASDKSAIDSLYDFYRSQNQKLFNLIGHTYNWRGLS